MHPHPHPHAPACPRHQLILRVFGVCVDLDSLLTAGRSHGEAPHPGGVVHPHLLLLRVEPDALANEVTTARAPHVEGHLKAYHQDALVQLARPVSQRAMRVVELRGRTGKEGGMRRGEPQTRPERTRTRLRSRITRTIPCSSFLWRGPIPVGSRSYPPEPLLESTWLSLLPGAYPKQAARGFRRQQDKTVRMFSVKWSGIKLPW